MMISEKVKDYVVGTAFVCSVFALVIGGILYFNLTLDSEERFFQDKIMVDYKGQLKAHRIESVAIEPRSHKGRVACEVSVEILIDDRKLRDSFYMSGGHDSSESCRIGFSKIWHQSAIWSFPEYFRAEIDPDLYFKDAFQSLDLQALRSLRENTEALLPRIFEFSDSMRAEYHSLVSTPEDQIASID